MSVRSHQFYCMREKPTIVWNRLQEPSLDSSDLAEKLDTGPAEWFGGAPNLLKKIRNQTILVVYWLTANTCKG